MRFLIWVSIFLAETLRNVRLFCLGEKKAISGYFLRKDTKNIDKNLNQRRSFENANSYVVNYQTQAKRMVPPPPPLERCPLFSHSNTVKSSSSVPLSWGELSSFIQTRLLRWSPLIILQPSCHVHSIITACSCPQSQVLRGGQGKHGATWPSSFFFI